MVDETFVRLASLCSSKVIVPDGVGCCAFAGDKGMSYPEPNLTTLVNFESKWADMIPEGTAVPTPPAVIPNHRFIKTDEERRELNAATQRVGVFEGGGYQSKGVYRPAQECRMKVNEVDDFCPVCCRAIRRITDFYTSH